MKKTGIKKTFFLTNNVDRSDDPLREVNNNYWFFDPNLNDYYVKTNNEFRFKIDDKNVFYTTLETPPSETKFNDMVFDAILPYAKLPPDKLTDLASISSIEITTKRSVNDISYNDFITSGEIAELDITNYYLYLSRDFIKNDSIDEILSNGFLINQNLLDNTNTLTPYFKRYSETYTHETNDNLRGGPWKDKFEKFYKRKLRTIVLDNKNFEYVIQNNKKVNLFPNYIKLDIFKDTSDLICESLQDTRMNLRFFSDLVGNSFGLQSLNFNYKLSFLTQETTQSQDITQDYVRAGKESLPYMDYIAWVNKSLDPRSTHNTEFFNFSDTNALFIGSTDSLDLPSTTENQFLANLYSRVLAGKTKFIIDKNLRTYQDIILGKKCYTEVVAFRIDKLRKGQSTIIQSYYFENDTSELLQFIDTQIKPQTEYKYDIYYYIAVLGNQYSYQNYQTAKSERASKKQTSQGRTGFGMPTNVEEDSGGQGFPQVAEDLSGGRLVQVINEPLLYIFPVKATNLIKDFVNPPDILSPVALLAPPLTPIVTPYPFKDVRGKIRFAFAQTIGTSRDYYATITQKDVEDAQKILAGQQESNKDGKITFTTELNENGSAKVEDFLVYRMEKMPFEYKDFGDVPYAEINNLANINGLILTSFDDNIELNKKYYYMFRSRNSDTFSSNPSPVYEVELVLNSTDSDFPNSGTYYSIIKVIDFDRENDITKNLNFKQYFKIKPAFIQKLIKDVEQKPSTTDRQNLGEGNVKDSVWNKNFKIRLTSKQSGRKVDINFKMKYVPKNK
jgi:hypothetical protein